jgi:hypothetical protein
MAFAWPSWDEWLATKDHETAERAVNLLETFKKVGCPDPEGWVRSEIDEDFAQLARFVFLRLVWDEVLQPWRDEATVSRFPAGRAMVEACGSAEQLRELGGSVASDTVWKLLTLLDGSSTHPLGEELRLPGWRLMETGADANVLTGREVGGLHESISEVDPEGRGGEPLL